MENVRLLVQEEGRAARNLIAFSVPIEHSLSDSIGKVVRKPPTSPRPPGEGKKEDSLRPSKRSCDPSNPSSRVRSASTGRDKKSELQARHWAFLFDNLQRAVDEIYQTCESDENVSECKEVILVLENYTRDFDNLIKWFKVKWEYENTPPPQRPTSLTWEVRKSSPGKTRNMVGIESNSSEDEGKVLKVNSSKERTIVFSKKTKVPGVNLMADSENVVGGIAQVPETDANTTGVIINNIIQTQDSDAERELSAIQVSNVEDNNASIVPEGPISSWINPVTVKSSAILTSVDEVCSANVGNLEDCATKCENMCIMSKLEEICTSGGQRCDTSCSRDDVQNTSHCNSLHDSSTDMVIQSDQCSTSTTSILDDSIICKASESNVSLANQQTGESVDGGGAVEVDDQSKVQEPNVEDKRKDRMGDINVDKIGDAESSNSKEEVVKMNQTTQTDHVQCIEDKDGLRFLALPQSGTPQTVLTPSQVKSVVPPVRPILPRVASTLRVVTPSRSQPAAPVVSRLVGPRPQAAFPRVAAPNPRLLRSRTSTDVRPAGRGVPVVKMSSFTSPGVRLQRPVLPSRYPSSQVSTLARVGGSGERLVETEADQQRQKSGSNSSLNSSASSGARSWADKVKGSEHISTTTSVEVLPRNNEDDDTQGWETVKVRSRSRISPANKVLDSTLSQSSGSIKSRTGNLSQSSGNIKSRTGNLSQSSGSIKSRTENLSQSSGNIKSRNGPQQQVWTAKMRFHQPSSATSLPALSLGEVEVHPPTVSRGSTSILPRKDDKGSKEEINRNTKKCRMQGKTGSQDVLKPANIGVKPHIRPVQNGIMVPKPSDSPSQEPIKVLVKKVEEECNKTDLIDVPENLDRKSGDEEMVLDDKLDDILDEKNLFNEDELRKSKELCAEVAMLRKEIHELETAEIEVDTETDETETDGEATMGPEDDEDCDGTPYKDPDVEKNLTLEDRYENMLEGMSWAERKDTLEQLEELVARHPGRALELHQKLSSPSRRRTLPETLRRFNTRQAQAKEKRDKLMQEKTHRLRELLNKVDEVKAAKTQSIEDRRVRLEMKLKRAEANRNLHLRGIVRKAHDEEEKLKEIAFINELEAQNKRHDFMALCQEQEERLQGIHEERQRKQEEKAAKEAAVEERRRVLEAERQERLEKMQEIRRKREERVGRQQQEREKERQELAREKARDREERLSALHAAQLATQEELQKKIQQKQEESARRHEENMEHIRQRALELSILRCTTDDVAPRLAPYDTKKLCEVCNVLIGSEVYLLSHLRGKKHQEAIASKHELGAPSREELTSYNIRYIVDAPADKIDPKIALDKERQKALKKRCKKIRLRMAARGQEYESKRNSSTKMESPNKSRIQKCLKDVEKLHNSQGKGQWPNNAITSLERALGEINRILKKQNALDQMTFQALNGFSTVSSVLTLSMDIPFNMAPYLPPKCFMTTCTTFHLACAESPTNSKYVLFSNKVSTVLDLLLYRLTLLIPDRNRMNLVSSPVGSTQLPVDTIAGALMRLLALILTQAAADTDDRKEELSIRIQDVISYTVSVGIVDKLAVYCGGVRDPIDGDPSAAYFLLTGLELLTTLSERCGAMRRGSHPDDPTQLVATLQVTELVGGASMLYGMLLHQDAPPRGTSSPPPALPSHTIAVAIATIKLLSRVAELDLHMFQSVLGAEGISLQFRHIASYLLWYCSHGKETALLHEVVRVVGFFAVRNHDNQMMIQSGYMPTVLQQLCNLPFPYFSNPLLSCLLLPTLLACCSDNRENRVILEQEVSYQLLEDFRNSEAGKNNRLVLLLGATTT